MNPALAPIAALRAKFPFRRGVFRLFASADCACHDADPDSPERPARLVAALEGLASLPTDVPLALAEPPPAKWGDLRNVHAPEYVDALESVLLFGRPEFMSRDCPVGIGSDDAILAAAGLAFAMGNALASGTPGFAITRPPGHHAGRTRTGGFCFTNHAALAVHAIRSARHGARVAVVDLDVHFGDGTADCLRDRENVLFASIHGDPIKLYPGTGFVADDRDAPARLRHLPLADGAGRDAWFAALDTALRDLDAFRPTHIVVSLGLDAHEEDPSGFLRLSDDDYAVALERLCETANRLASGRLGLVLEGGYSTEVLARLTPRLAAIGAYALRFRPASS